MASTEASANSYIGCFLSILSKSDMRYAGVLYRIDTQDAAIGLANGTASFSLPGLVVSSESPSFIFLCRCCSSVDSRTCVVLGILVGVVLTSLSRNPLKEDWNDGSPRGIGIAALWLDENFRGVGVKD